MNAIKIVVKNKEVIESALKAVNGKAEAHAYTTYEEIYKLTTNTEEKLSGLLYKKDWPGSIWSETSGGRVANSYKYMRDATAVQIIYKKSGWYLISIDAIKIGNNGGGMGRLYLTPEQDTAAKNKLADSYTVICSASYQKRLAA